MKRSTAWIAAIIVLVVIACILAVFTKETANSFIVVFALVYLLYLPGYFLTLGIFGDSLDDIERLTLSIALSMASVTLIVIFCNKFLHVPFTRLMIGLEVLIVIIIGFLLILWKKLRNKKKVKKK
jgi:uncharacterized membrane protein